MNLADFIPEVPRLLDLGFAVANPPWRGEPTDLSAVTLTDTEAHPFQRASA